MWLAEHLSAVLAFDAPASIVFATAMPFPFVLMMILTEKTIAINTVGDGEKLWTFGQTFALMSALLPAILVGKQAVEIVRNIGQRQVNSYEFNMSWARK